MAGSDDSISSAASSGSDGEHSRPTSAAASSSRNSTKSSKCRIKRRQNVAITASSASSVATGTVRHRHRHKLSHRFEFVRTLGCGTYGKVKLAVQLDSKEEVAIKCIPKSKIDNAGDLKRLRQEVEVMSSLHHPHIVKVTEVFESRDKIVIVMEYAPGGELYDYINDGKLSTSDAKKMFGEVVSAVHYLHKNNIVHRDLKLENVLLDSNYTVKIADFGLSSTYNHSSLLDTFCGSPLYASPEIINGTPYHGPEVDCWSLGVILYAMVYKTMPFQGSDFTQLKTQITGGAFYEPNVPSDASDLIHRMLTVDPRERITIEEILNHPWLCDGIRPCRKDPEVRQTEVADYTTQNTRDGAVYSCDDRLSGAVKKPLAGILKKSLRKSSHRIGSDDSGVMSFVGKEDPGQDRAEDLWKDTEGAESLERPKAKKGILKKQGKDSGRDSGLGINESGQSKSNASLDLNVEGEKHGAKEKSKRDSGIDQDLSTCSLPAENTPQHPTCKLRDPNRLNYVCKITRRHSRGKYSKVAKMWESIYSTSISNAGKDAPPKRTKDAQPKPSSEKAAAELEHNNSSSSNEDILGILDSPDLRTPTLTKKFQYTVEEAKTETTETNAGHSSAEFAEEENYTRDELMGAMDEELLEVYKKALKISQAIM